MDDDVTASPERREPATQTMEASDAQQRWPVVLDDVSRRVSRVLVEREGVPVAAVVSFEDLVQLQRLAEQRQRGFDAMTRISQSFADVPVEDLEGEVAKVIAQVRSEDRRSVSKTA
jgi:class 3 adenylate cyclase